MSLSQELSGYLGPLAGPAALGSATLAAFEFLDRISSPEAKLALTRRLQGLDVHAAAVLPKGTRQLFQRVFGERHFSLRCFARSAIFSVTAILLLAGLAALYFPFLRILPLGELFFASFDRPMPSVNWKAIFEKVFISFLAVWIAWSVIVDYFNLLKTRLILNMLAKSGGGRVLTVIALLFADAAAAIAMFFVSLVLVHTTSNIYFSIWGRSFGALWTPPRSISEFLAYRLHDLSRYSKVYSERLIGIVTLRDTILNSVLFYAGLVPSIWLWAYVSALSATSAIVRTEKMVRWLRWFLDVKKNPFRSVGIVASIFVFLGSSLFFAVSSRFHH